jgi:hypothetical protein
MLVRENLDVPYVRYNKTILPQDAQKVRPARPQRVKDRGGTYRTSCGPFALDWILANGKAPPVIPTSENLLPYVEDLNDARTQLTGFFSILLKDSAVTVPHLSRHIIELRQMQNRLGHFLS